MRNEKLFIEESEGEIFKERRAEQENQIAIWATDAIKHFNVEYEQMLEKYTTVRDQPIVKNIAGLKNTMELSVREILNQQLSDQEKRQLIKWTINSYKDKRDSLLEGIS